MIQRKDMMTFGIILMLVLICLTTQADMYAQKNTTKRKIDAFIWELKPYVFTENGKIKGMIHSYFEESLKAECQDYQKVSDVVRVKHIYSDIKEFRKALADIQNGVMRPEFENSSSLTYWYPLLGSSEIYGEKLKMIVSLPSKSVAILTRQNAVDIGSKFFISLTEIRPFLLILAIGSIMFAVLIWIIENRSRSVECFTVGWFRTLWCVLVTTTSVGYGDDTPKTILARILTVVWMILGVLLSSALTAIVYLHLNENSWDGTQIGVLNNSIEMNILTELQKKVKAFDTYEELIEALQNQHEGLTIAAINGDVVSYYRQQWNEHVPYEKAIAVIDIMDVSLPVNVAEHGIGLYNGITLCYNLDINMLAKHARFMYNKRVQITANDELSILSMLSEHNQVFILNCVIITCISLGILHDVGRKLMTCLSSRRTIVITNNVDVPTRLGLEGQRVRYQIMWLSKEISNIKNLTAQLADRIYHPKSNGCHSEPRSVNRIRSEHY